MTEELITVPAVKDGIPCTIEIRYSDRSKVAEAWSQGLLFWEALGFVPRRDVSPAPTATERMFPPQPQAPSGAPQQYAPPPAPPQQYAPATPQQQWACPVHGTTRVKQGKYGPECSAFSNVPVEWAKPNPFIRSDGTPCYYCTHRAG